MVDMTHDKREYDDAAFVDAYERRLAGGRPEDVPAAWREEIEQMVVIHERLAALPLPDVSPAVRSAVLTAAAQAAAERPQSLWSKIAEFLMRPGPILATAAALALLVAVGQRQTKPAVDAGAVAVSEPAPPPEVAQAAPAPTAPAQPQVAKGADKDEAAPAPPAAAAPPAFAEPPPALAKAEAARPTRTIAAQPASIAPEMPGSVAGSVAGSAEREKQAAQLAAQAAAEEGKAAAYAAKEDRKAAEVAAKVPPAPVMGMARAQDNRGQNLDQFNKANQAPQAQRVEADADQAVAAQDSKKAQESSKDNAEVAKSEVQQLKAAVDKTTDPAKRKALLVKLRAAALQAGDGKTAQWAEQALAANNANESSAGGVPNKAKAAPAKSEAPAAEKTSY